MTHSNEYKNTLRRRHDSTAWGGSGYRHAGDLFLERLLVRSNIKTVLDFGCGLGTMKPFLEQRHPHITVSEYDPGVAGKDKMPAGTFDCVLSSDVLEHVEPDELIATLADLASKADILMMHDIACYPTRRVFKDGPYVGQDLHLIIKKPLWWRGRFDAHLEGFEEVEFQQREFKTNRPYPKTRCLLLHERLKK